MKFHSFRILQAAIVTALAVTPMAASATNGYFSHGFGARNEALAGAGIAFSQDGLAAATNPAGLVDVADGFDAGLALFRPSRSATLVQGGDAVTYSGNGRSTFVIPSFGYTHKLNERVTLGVALYGNGGMNTNYGSNPFARFGATGAAGVDLTQAFVSPSIAVRVGERQSFGLAANIAYQRFAAKGIGLFADFSQDGDNVSNRGHDDSLGVGVRLGWQAHVTDSLTLGATWQSRINTGRFKKYAGLFADRGGFDIPATWGVGAAWRVTDDWHIALDWQRIDYSAVNSVGNSIASLFGGSPLGSADGPGFGWRDVSVVKLGTQVKVSPQLTLRAGISHNRQPVRAGETFFNILAPGVVRTHATLGAGWRLSDQNELNFSYLHAFRKTVQGSGSIPPAFGGGEANVRLTEDTLGVSFSHRF